MDVFIVARSVAIMATLFTGPLSVTFLTVYATKTAGKKRRGAMSLASSTVTLSCIIMGLTVLLLALFAPQITRLVAPGFQENTYVQAVSLARLLLPFMIFPLLAAFSKSILNTHQDFATPVIADVIEHLVVIGVILVLAQGFGTGALAIAAVAGYIVLFGVQGCVLRSRRLLPNASLAFDADTRRVVALAVPLIGRSFIGRIHHMVDRALASALPVGSVAVLDYAERLRGVPLGIFVAAALTVLFPTLSRMWGKGETCSFADTISSGLQMVEFICVPAAAGMMVLAGPLTRIAFERGAFTAGATRATAAALVAYGPGLVAVAALQVINAGFMSAQKTGIPVLLGAVMSATNIGFDLALVTALGHVGLALASSLAAVFTMLVALCYLKKAVKEVSLFSLADSLGKALVCSTMMAAVVLKLSEASGLASGTGSLAKDGVLVLGMAAAGAAIYWASAFLIGLAGATPLKP